MHPLQSTRESSVFYIPSSIEKKIQQDDGVDELVMIEEDSNIHCLLRRIVTDVRGIVIAMNVDDNSANSIHMDSEPFSIFSGDFL